MATAQGLDEAAPWSRDLTLTLTLIDEAPPWSRGILRDREGFIV